MMNSKKNLTHMTSKLFKVFGAGVAATTATALAGDFSTGGHSPVDHDNGAGDWCETLQDIGVLYKDKSNPWIQEIKVFGRAHYQYGYTDGDVDGDDFSGDGGELRRFRAGASVKFLNGFKAVGRANFERGGFRDNSIGYNGWDEIYLEKSFDDYAGLEDITVGYGRYKLGFGGEESYSSKKLKTIERSLLNNYFAGDRVTGTKIEASRGGVDVLLGVFTTDGNDETFGQWDGGVIYQLDLAFEALGGAFLIQGIYRDSNNEEQDETVDYDWAASVTYETKLGPVDLFLNSTYGSDDDGDVYGVIVMPSVELVKDKVEAVIRYQWAHSTGDELRLQSRNTRNVLSGDGLSDIRGDDHHSIYAGLNYFLCGHNLKILTGVEYETLDGPNGDTEATTLWAAARFFF